MDLLLLGPIAAATEGRTIPLGPQQQRAVLAMLALEANRPVSADRLIDGLWGESPPASAPKMVQLYISQLRKALAGSAATIVTRGRSYVLECDGEAIDVERANHLLVTAADASAPNGHARAALALWRGPSLADLADEPFAAPEIRRLDELRLRAQELAIDADLAAGRHDSVLGEAAQLAAEHPLREHVQAQHMLALYRGGRQAEALEAFRSARAGLVEEVGAEPGSELRELHAAMLRQDPALDAPARARTASPRTNGRAAARVRRQRLLLPLIAAVVACAAIAAVVLALRSGSDDPVLTENSVGELDAGSGDLRASYRVGHGPGPVAVGAGSTWVANTTDGTVTRIDPARDEVVTIDVGAHPSALAFGAGSLWIASGDDEAIAQVDPGTNRVVQRIPVGGQPQGIAVGFGSVWVAEPREDVVARVDLAKGRTAQRISAGAGPVTVAAGAGAVWVAAEESGRLVRIEPRSGIATAAVNVGHGPAAVAIGAGAVWVANRPDGTVSRVDPATATVAGAVKVGGSADALAVGDGGLWVLDEAGRMIVRVDTASGRVVRRERVAVSPGGVAVVDGSAWVTATGAATGHRGGTLIVAGQNCGKGCPLDPDFAHSAYWDVLTVAYDGLVGYRRVPGTAGETLVPALAEALPEPQDGGRTYAFTLRPGLRYWDGRPVRAGDISASLERVLRRGAIVPGYFSSIRGADACWLHGRCRLARSVVADEQARTITFRLLRPDPQFLQRLANPIAAIVPSGTPVELPEGAFPVGTGPYRIVSSDSFGGGRLERNRYFRSWSPADRPPGYADAIVVRRRAGANARIAAVGRGAADLTSLDNGGRELSPERLAGVLTRYPSRIATAPWLATDFMFLNVSEPPFDDVRVRRAVNLATDRKLMVRFGGGTSSTAPTCQIVPPSIPGSQPYCPYTRDPSPAGTWNGPDVAAARRLIAASGTAGMAVTVWTDDAKVRYGRYFERLLGRLGYRARLRVLPAGYDYFHAVADSRKHAQIGMFGWFADYPDPATFFDPMFSCSGRLPESRDNLNLSQICSPALDRAVAAATEAQGPAAEDAWAAAERRLAELAPAVPLTTRRRSLFYSARAGNAEQNPFLGVMLDRIWVN